VVVVRAQAADEGDVRRRDPRWRGGLDAVEASVGRGRSALQATQAVDVAESVPNDLLTKLDRLPDGRARGVEGRDAVSR
jgi:asparagine synthase (glutamine-hydrolysing)